jgi:Phage integrase family
LFTVQIRVAQQKTAAKLTIPIHDTLDRILKIADRDQSTILVRAYGQPFSVKGFGNMVSAAIHEAGLPDRCKPHGLRKAAARRLAEAGCSKARRSPDIRRWRKWNATRAPQTKRDWPDRPFGSRLKREVANDSIDTLEINSLMANLALPREAGESNKINTLRNCLGKIDFIDLQGLSTHPLKRTPRRQRLQRSRAQRDRNVLVRLSPVRDLRARRAEAASGDYGCFWGQAEIDLPAKSADSVENDPNPTSAARPINVIA